MDWNPACYGYTVGSPDGDRSFDTRDSAPFVPKCRVIDPAFTWGRDPRADDPVGPHDLVRGPHVRGPHQTASGGAGEAAGDPSPGSPAPRCWTTIKSLGVTAVELLPIHTFINDEIPAAAGTDQLLGLQLDRVLLPRPALRLQPGLRLFRVQADGGCGSTKPALEVILDVVYNHTAEGNEQGATLSFRGIDNLSYYRLMPSNKRLYINDTGTGNTVNISHPRVLQMVTDSLRYWVTEMHVDGFRFDLAHHPGA